uniref:non-specific serine/threonine protein kinase n=2 Tax=Anthurium amnicola TaxID=1678845 RepID=A0A1D1Y4H4_9ARAE
MARPWWFLLMLWASSISLSLLSSSSSSAQQLSPSQTKTLLRLHRILEYPPAFNGWTNYTNPCYLPPSPSLSLVCCGYRVTELSVSGAPGAARLSPSFSIDSLFTTLSRLPSLTVLSLVSLGLWGPLPAKVHRFPSLRVLNLSSNHISGGIPREISTMASLLSLVLDGNQLNGTVPDLGSLPALEEVNLAGNRLGPEFPALGRSVVAAVLRNNSFRATIPPATQRLGNLQRLDASSNQLVGPIPPFLLSLPSLRHLDLSRNLLAGPLPANLSCGAQLEFVDISGNRLVGWLPACIRSNSSGVVLLDSGNCLASGDSRYQHPSSYCNEGAIAAAVPTTNKGGQFKNKLGFILGIVGGIVGAAVVLGLVLFLISMRARRENAGMGGLLKSVSVKSSSVLASPPPRTDARHMSHAVRLGTMGLMPYREFRMEELEEATNNFDSSNLMQENSQHQMYRGWLQDGSTIIIRCLKLKQRYSPQSVAQFIDVTSKLRHRHLVSILGHCINSEQENSNAGNCVYLVLENISNGTLRSHLTEWRKREMLKWPQRVAAAIGVARGIQFLHTVTAPGISGNDLNIENILLDQTLTAKISNYNLPMLPKNKNNKGGTENSSCPIEDGVRAYGVELGEKEDVYQLGLILMEIITGKPVLNKSELDAMRNKLQKSLMEGLEDLRELVDLTIQGTFAYDSLRTAVELALSCVSNDRNQQPSIDDILWNLQYSVQVQDGWASCESLSNHS